MKIKQNKKQTVFFAFFLLAVFALLFWFAVFDARDIPHDKSFLLDTAAIYWSFRIVSAISAVLVAMGECYFIKELFSDKPLIEICDDYFYDHSSAISYGKIAWSDMKCAYFKGGFLNIDLKNPEEYIKRMNKIQKLMIRSNARMGYGHICISLQRFKKEGNAFLDEFCRRMTVQ